MSFGMGVSLDESQRQAPCAGRHLGRREARPTGETPNRPGTASKRDGSLRGDLLQRLRHAPKTPSKTRQLFEYTYFYSFAAELCGKPMGGLVPRSDASPAAHAEGA